MMKFIRTVLSLVLLISLSGISVSADDSYAESREAAKSPACQYMVSYTEASRANDPYSITTATGVNQTPTTQRVVVTRTRSRTFSGNVSLYAERNTILSKVGGNVEVSYGQTDTVAVSAEMVVPAYTTYSVDLGSVLLTTTGTIKVLNEDCSRVNKSATLRWTTGEYIRWYQ